MAFFLKHGYFIELFFSRCRPAHLGQHTRSSFSRKRTTEGLRVSSEGQSISTEERRAKLPLHGLNRPKPGVSALELSETV